MGNRSDAAAKGLGGDQVEGRQAVRELLLAGTRRTREVILAGDLDPAPILDDIIDLVGFTIFAQQYSKRQHRYFTI